MSELENKRREEVPVETMLNPAGENAPGYDLNGAGASVQEPQKPEKKPLEGPRLFLLTMAVVLGIGAIVAFFVLRDTNSEPKPKTFTQGPVTITLTNKFWTEESTARSEGFDAVFSSQEVGVFAYKRAYTVVDELADYSPEDFAGALVYTAGIPTLAMRSEDGLVWFSYDDEGADGELYRYFVHVYKTDSAFWMVEFAVRRDQAAALETEIHGWAKTVEIKD